MTHLLKAQFNIKFNLIEMGMLGSKLSPFPMEQQHKLSAHTDDPISNPSQYRCLIARLIYLTITRPNVTYVIHILSQFMQDLIGIIYYLKSSLEKGIHLPSSNDHLSLHIYCDSDWASCPMTCCSIIGHFVLPGSALIS